MPRTPEENKKIKLERKKSILKASLRLFALYGVENVAMDSIADRVGCSHGLLYHYYANKTEILMDLQSESKNLFQGNFRSLIESENDPYKFLQKFNHLFISSINESEEKQSYLFLFLNEVVKNRRTIGKDKYFKAVNQKIIDGQNKGLFKTDNSLSLIFIYISTLLGYTYYLIKTKEKHESLDENVFLNVFMK